MKITKLCQIFLKLYPGKRGVIKGLDLPFTVKCILNDYAVLLEIEDSSTDYFFCMSGKEVLELYNIKKPKDLKLDRQCYYYINICETPNFFINREETKVYNYANRD